MAMMNHKRFSVPRKLTTIALAMTLAACVTTPPEPVNVDITLDPTLPVQSYMINADSSQGSVQNDWLIMATKAALKNGDVEQADLLVKRLAKQQLTELQQAEWQLSRATLQQMRGQSSRVIELLNFKPWWAVTPAQWEQYYTLRANARQALNQPFEANRELILLAQYSNELDQSRLATQVWQNFAGYSQYEITELTTAPEEDILDGWLQLAIYVKTMSDNVPQLKNTLDNWFAENGHHPAAHYTPVDVQEILDLQIIKPSNTALLLPLTGQFGKQAQLIRDGFIFAMMNDKAREPDARLTVIDTHTHQPEEIRARINEEGVDFIVGPLRKDRIKRLQDEMLAAEEANKIPALALNIPNEVLSGNQVCYLALSPEQEVAQAARHLFKNGYQYPLILAPKGNLGERVTAAFNDEWKKYSANKVAVSLFENKRQLQRSINDVFGLQESQQRIAQMTSLLNVAMENQPRSRRDIDAVYIVAKSSELTLIKPFVEVAVNPDATPPKLFSNSRSNSGKKQYEDLTGIEYSDIPLLINANPSILSQMQQLWPGQSNMEKRLHALGMDAYSLIEELPQMKVMSSHSVNGQTGILSIDDNCVVQREVSWAGHGTLQ